MKKRRGRIAARTVTGLLLVIGAVIVWRALAPPLLLGLARSAIDGALPWPSATVRLGSMDIRGLRRVLVEDIRIDVNDTGDVIRADTVELSFSPWALLRARRLTSVSIVGASVDATRRDSIWPLLDRASDDDPSPAPGRASSDGAGSSWTVGRVTVTRAGMEARDTAGLVFSIEGLQAGAQDVTVGRGGGVSIDSLVFQLGRPGWPAATVSVRDVTPSGQAGWSVGSAVVTDAAGASVRAGGSVGPVGRDGPALDLRVEASGLSGRSLPAAAGSLLAPAALFDVEGTVTGSPDDLLARLTLLPKAGGSVDLDISVDRTEPAVVLLDVDAVVSGLDLQPAFSTRTPGGALHGTVEARLAFAGSGPEGPMRLDLRLMENTASAAGTDPGRTRASLGGQTVFAADRVDVDVVVEGDFGRWTVRGPINTLGDTTGFSLVADGTAVVPWPAWLVAREPTLGSAFRGEVRFDGSGLTPGSMNATLDATLTASGDSDDRAPDGGDDARQAGAGARASGPSASDGRGGAHADLTGRIEGGIGRFDADVSVSTGRIALTGSVPLTDAQAGWRLTRIAVQDVRTAPWLHDDPGRMWLSAAARGTPAGAVVLAAVDSVIGGRLDGLTGDLRFERESTMRISGTLGLNEALVDVTEVVATRAGLRAVDVAFRDVDPSVLSPSFVAAGLSGKLTLEADTTAGSLDARTLAGALTFEDASLRGDPLEGRVDLRLDGWDARFDADLTSAGEEVLAAGRLLAGFDRGLTLRDVRLTRFDPSRWIGPIAPAGSLTGRLDADATVAAGRDATVSFDVTISDSRLGLVSIDSLRTHLNLADGRGTFRLDGTGSGRRLALEGEAERSVGARWDGDTRLVLLDRSTPAAGPDSLVLEASSFVDRGGDTPRWHASVAGSGTAFDLRFDSIAAEIGVERASTLTIDRLVVAGPDLEATGSGSVALSRASDMEGDLVAEVLAPDLGPVLRVVGRDASGTDARLSLALSGPANGLRQRARLSVDDVTAFGVGADSLRVTIDGWSDESTWLAGLRARARAGGSGTLRLGRASGPQPLGLGASASAGVVTASVAWRAGSRSTLTVEEIAATIDEVPWRSDEAFDVSWAPTIEVGNAVLRSATGSVELSGRIDRRGQQNFRVHADALPFHLVSQDATELSALLDLTAVMTGSASEPSVQLEGAVRSTTSDATVDYSAASSLDGLRVALDVAQAGGGRIDAKGSVPVRISLQGDTAFNDSGALVDLDVALVDFDLAGLTSLIGEDLVGTLQATLDADAAIGGPLSDPVIGGHATLTGVAFHLEPSDTDLTAERLAVTFDRQQIRIEEGTLRDTHGGSMRMVGTVDMTSIDDPAFDLNVELESFQAVDNGTAEATASGRIDLDGSLSAPSLTGRMVLDHAEYRVPASGVSGSVEPIDLTADDLQELEARFGIEPADVGSGRSSSWEGLSLDVSVEASSNVWARRAYDPALAVELVGEVRATKAPADELRMTGELRVVEGRSSLQQFGRRFDVARGSIVFDGPPTDLELDARATYEVEDAEIWIDVRRNSEGLSFVLGSDPEMEATDIISYLASGRRATDVERFGGDDVDAADVGTNIAFGRLTAGVEEIARQRLGLDVVEIEQDGLNGLTLAAGRFVGPRLYVGFAQPVAFSGGERSRFGIDETELNAEYRVNEWLLTKLSGSSGLIRVFLAVERAY